MTTPLPCGIDNDLEDYPFGCTTLSLMSNLNLKVVVFFSNVSRLHNRASAWYLFASNEYQKINKLSSPLKKWPNLQAYPSFLGRSRGGETVQEAHHVPTTFFKMNSEVAFNIYSICQLHCGAAQKKMWPAHCDYLPCFTRFVRQWSDPTLEQTNKVAIWMHLFKDFSHIVSSVPIL